MTPKPGITPKMIEAGYDAHYELPAPYGHFGTKKFVAAIYTAMHAAAGDGWQDIATAPKDGTPVDLWGTRNSEPRRFPRARWTENVWAGQKIGVFSWSHYGWDIYGVFEYTHWRLEPAPPSEPAEDV